MLQILLHTLHKYVSEVLIESVAQQNHGEKEQFHYQFPVTAFNVVSSYLSPQVRLNFTQTGDV